MANISYQAPQDPTLQLSLPDIVGAAQKTALGDLAIQSGQRQQSQLNQLGTLGPQLAAGDPNARAQLLGMDPSISGPVSTTMDALNAAGRQQKMFSAGLASSMAGNVIAMPADQQAGAYSVMRQHAITAGMDPSMLPEQFPGTTALLGIRNSAVPVEKQIELNANYPTTDPRGPLGLPPGGGVAPPGTAAIGDHTPGALGSYINALQQSENPNPAAVNAKGFVGSFQFGEDRLKDLNVYTPAPGENTKANRWQGTFNIPGFPQVKTLNDFLNTPQGVAAQQAVVATHVADIDQAIASTPGAQGMSLWGLRSVAHLGGVGGMKKFVQSGGLYDPGDNPNAPGGGTHLSDYYRRFAAMEAASPLMQQRAQQFAQQQWGSGASGQPPATAPAAVPAAPGQASVPASAPAQAPGQPSAPQPVQVASAQNSTGMPPVASDAAPAMPVVRTVPNPFLGGASAPMGGLASLGPPSGGIQAPTGGLASLGPQLPVTPPGASPGGTVTRDGIMSPGGVLQTHVNGAPVGHPLAPTAPVSGNDSAVPAPQPPMGGLGSLVLGPGAGAPPNALGSIGVKPLFQNGRPMLVDNRPGYEWGQTQDGSRVAMPIPGAGPDLDMQKSGPYLLGVNKQTGAVTSQTVVPNSPVDGRPGYQWVQGADGILQAAPIAGAGPDLEVKDAGNTRQFINKQTGQVVREETIPDTSRTTWVTGPNGQQIGYQSGKPIATVGANTLPAQSQTYEKDQDVARDLAAAGRDAEGQISKALEVRNLAAGLPTGAGGERRAALANVVQTYLGDSAADFLKRQGVLPDAAQSQEAAKLMLGQAGTDERSVAGGRGGLGLTQLFQRANPNLDLQPDAIRDISNLKAVTAQAQKDYIDGAVNFVNTQGDQFLHQGQPYQPLTNYDQQWLGKPNVQTYMAAINAMNGKPFSEWSKNLDTSNSDSVRRVVGIIQRIDPNAASTVAAGIPNARTQAGGPVTSLQAVQQAQRELADTVKNMAPDQANGVVQARADEIMQQAGSAAAVAPAPAGSGLASIVPAPRAAAPTGPAVGTVQQGYRFNGGDPSNPASWARVQ